MKPRFILDFLSVGTKKSPAGFALPLVIMAGLVITVAAAAIAMKGMNDQNQVTAQKAKNSSREAAETGIERIKATMVSSPAARYMALYNSSQWNNLLNNDGSVNSSANATLAATLTNYLTELAKQTKEFTCTGNTATAMTALQGKLVPFKNTVTQASLPIQSDLSYRLVSYEYGGTQGVLSTTPQTGTLTIEGFSSTGTTSGTRLRVQIPISSNPSQRQDLGPTIPGLWMKEQGLANGTEPAPPFSNNSLGNQRYDADVVFNDCTDTINQQYMDFVNDKTPNSPILVGDKKAYKASFPMPAVPPQPTIPSGQVFSGINGTMTLPRRNAAGVITDSPIDGVYYYRVNGDINLSGSSTLTITPGQKVVIYLNGNIVRGTNIAHSCTGVTGCTPSNFRIYGISTATDPELCLNGSDIVNGFILAPNYKAGVNGNGKFVGSLWVKSWGKISNCGSSGNQVVLEQNETWDKLPPELQPMKMSTPALQKVTSWQELEVSQAQ
ncbi:MULTISPECIES: hypothetical protein [unclassified Synechocystis]|uniref:DUF7305 domain-containing protein n=1 Tax=unclassified Synechocystis TaxID=2640012 RepID=UPI0003FD0AB3|nr:MULTISPECIES: hypothetical protein [unclassified Synechocystis]AIE74717.1 hypothetical protein D082_21890 [Synechocystis sp. PCC 6714]MCT0253930.1 hypothetical protein [Synechocystis sp. CS-94]